MWVNHHSMFSTIVRIDRPLLLLNLLRLTGVRLERRAEWAAVIRFSVGTVVYAATIGIAYVSATAAPAIQFLLAGYYAFEQITA